MHNRFEFLDGQFPEIADCGRKAEETLGRDNNICLLNLGRIAEKTIQHLCRQNNIHYAGSTALSCAQELLDGGAITEGISTKINALLETKQEAVSEGYDSEMACERLMSSALDLCEWLASTRKFDFMKDMFIPSENDAPFADIAGLGREAEDDIYTRPRYCLLCLGDIEEAITDIFLALSA